MHSAILGLLLCCVLVTAQKFYFDDIHVMIPTYEPKKHIIKFVNKMNSLNSTEDQKLQCKTFFENHLTAEQAPNRTKDCEKIVDQIANLNIMFGYIFKGIQKSGVIDSATQTKVQDLYYKEDQKFQHDSVPVGFTWTKKISQMMPIKQWNTLNATLLEIFTKFDKDNKKVSDALYSFHHPKDEEYYDRSYGN